MATCTAQIIVGSSGSGWGGEGGIGPSHVMYLIEGSRAGWVLEKVVHQTDPDAPLEPVTWIAVAPERIFADALVMIAARIDNDPVVQRLIEDRCGEEQADVLLHGDRNTPAQLDALNPVALDEIELAARSPIRSKLVITVMGESSLTGQLALLDQCSMEAEVCTVSWSRLIDANGNTQTGGALPPDDPEAHRFYELRT